MKGKRYTTEQKIRILWEADTVGKTILEVCREHGISEQTFHRWKRAFGMLELDQAKQLKELQKENAKLKRMLADEMLGKELLKEALEKCGKPRPQATGCRGTGGEGAVQPPDGMPSSGGGPQHLRLPSQGTQRVAGKTADGAAADVATSP